MRGDPQAEMLSDVSDKILVAGDDKSPPPGATGPTLINFSAVSYLLIDVLENKANIEGDLILN